MPAGAAEAEKRAGGGNGGRKVCRPGAGSGKPSAGGLVHFYERKRQMAVASIRRAVVLQRKRRAGGGGHEESRRTVCCGAVGRRGKIHAHTEIRGAVVDGRYLHVVRGRKHDGDAKCHKVRSGRERYAQKVRGSRDVAGRIGNTRKKGDRLVDREESEIIAERGEHIVRSRTCGTRCAGGAGGSRRALCAGQSGDALRPGWPCGSGCAGGTCRSGRAVYLCTTLDFPLC